MFRRRSLSLLTAAVGIAGFAFTQSASATIDIKVVPSSAPNVFGSPSWSSYASNALNGLLNNLAAVGDRNTDPTGYQAIPDGATIPAGDVMTTSFAAWRGVANPSAPFGSESGNRLHFGLVATGDGAQQFSLDDVSFAMDSSDGGNSLQYHDDLSGLTYNGTTRIGINWGADRAPGGGDDSIYSAGQSGSLPIDQLVYVGIGNSFWPGGEDPDPSNPLLGRQGAIDAQTDWIGANAPITVTTSYTIDGNSGSASVHVVPEPASLGMVGIAATTLFARRRRQRSGSFPYFF